MAGHTATRVKARGSATYIHRGTYRATTKDQQSASFSNHSVRNYQRRPEAVAVAKQPTNAALLLMAKNHESVIAATIQSAIASGHAKESIFVVDQNSTDQTPSRAIEQLGTDKVISLPGNSAVAIQSAVQQFMLASRYQWLFIAEADAAFSPDYFRVIRQKLNPKKHVLAVGFSQSLHGNWLGRYRDVAYRLSRSFGRLLQLSPSRDQVFHNSVVCIRIDALERLKPNSAIGSFDVLLQLQRLRVGKILFVRQAVSFTPQPQKLGDFCRQSLNLQREYFQSIRTYHVGWRPNRIDRAVAYQLLQTVILLAVVGLLLPLAISRTHNWGLLPMALAADYLLNSLLVLLVCRKKQNRTSINTLLYFYVVHWIELGIYLWAFMEVIGFDRFQEEAQTAEEAGRSLDPVALR